MASLKKRSLDGSNNDELSDPKRRKPSIPNVQSLSFVRPTKTTKQALYLRDDFRCWLCTHETAEILEVSHNLYAADPTVIQLLAAANESPISTQFLRYQSQGLFPSSLTHPAHIDNLILLCGLCHKLYDSVNPKWVMVPEDLEFFISWETRDYEQRRVGASRGNIAARSVPAADDYTKGFVPYFFDGTANWMLQPRNTTVFPKRYRGAPTACILKASLGTFQPFAAEPALGIGMPAVVKGKLFELLSLYERVLEVPPNHPMGPASVPRSYGGGQGDGDDGNDEGRAAGNNQPLPARVLQQHMGASAATGTTAVHQEGSAAPSSAQKRQRALGGSCDDSDPADQPHLASKRRRIPISGEEPVVNKLSTNDRPPLLLAHGGHPSPHTSRPSVSSSNDGPLTSNPRLPEMPFTFGAESSSASAMEWLARARRAGAGEEEERKGSPED